jgi:hypothetical protein
MNRTHFYPYLEREKERCKDHVCRVAGGAKRFVHLCGDDGAEVERVQKQVADQDVVEDALQLLVGLQDADGHNVA